MPENKRKNMQANKSFSPAAFLLIFSLFIISFGCAPTPSTGDGQQNPSASNDIPEITDENIREEINDVYLRAVPEENGAGEPISWRFSEDEPKEFRIVEKRTEGNRATIFLDIKTGSAQHSRTQRRLTGQISTKWELQTGWALRKWEIVESDNISMKYKNLTESPAHNSNR